MLRAASSTLHRRGPRPRLRQELKSRNDPKFAPPIAFVASVLGPLIGADLLHLQEIERLQTGMASIGGVERSEGPPASIPARPVVHFEPKPYTESCQRRRTWARTHEPTVPSMSNRRWPYSP
ncbi:MAG: DUF1614 domain-containing protein [Anaerolineae bacterium]